MRKTGVIHSVNLEKRYFSILHRKRLYFFYLQHSLIKKFQRYLFKGSLISFEYSDKVRIVDKKEAHTVEHFIFIMRKLRFREEFFYDLKIIKSGIKELFEGFENIMFLDLEMTMPGHNPANFKSEIIQAGFLITDKYGNTLAKESNYIRPTLTERLSRRTKEFLKIDETVFDNGLTYQEFYNEFDGYLKKYHPVVIVWGKNDILALKDSYKYNNVLPLKMTTVNILQLQKNYFNLKNDLGLFNAYRIYTGNDFEQKHDAFTDAFVTKEVFFEFKKIVSGEKRFIFPKE